MEEPLQNVKIPQGYPALQMNNHRTGSIRATCQSSNQEPWDAAHLSQLDPRKQKQHRYALSKLRKRNLAGGYWSKFWTNPMDKGYFQNDITHKNWTSG